MISGHRGDRCFKCSQADDRLVLNFLRIPAKLVLRNLIGGVVLFLLVLLKLVLFAPASDPTLKATGLVRRQELGLHRFLVFLFTVSFFPRFYASLSRREVATIFL